MVKEQHNEEALADIYAIIFVIDKLEKAYVRDVIVDTEYAANIQKLVAQYKTLVNSLGRPFDITAFAIEHNLSGSPAIHRIKIGIPATLEHASSSNSPVRRDPSAITKHVFEAVERIITLMDALKLNLVAVDQIHPLLTDLIVSIDHIFAGESRPFEERGKLLEWLKTLNSLTASDELNEEQKRQFMFDLEVTHSSLRRKIAS